MNRNAGWQPNAANFLETAKLKRRKAQANTPRCKGSQKHFCKIIVAK